MPCFLHLLFFLWLALGTALAASPAPTRLSIQVEGWRDLYHSYAVVGQNMALSLMRQGHQVTFKDVELYAHYREKWEKARSREIFSAQQYEQLKESADRYDPNDKQCPDVVLRIAFPYNFSTIAPPCEHTPVYVMGTTEYEVAVPIMLSNPLLLEVEEPPALPSNVFIITPSYWSSRGFKRAGFPSKSVHVIPHGFDASIFRLLPMEERQKRREDETLEKTLVILSAGSMTKNKGISLLLRSVVETVEWLQHCRDSHASCPSLEFTSLRLVLKGGDELYPSSQLLHQTANDDADFLARHELLAYVSKGLPFSAMADLYAMADVYVSPYSAEGFNLPVLEAMASGTAVYVSTGGSTDDFTRPSFTKYIPTRKIKVLFQGRQGRALLPSQPKLTELLKWSCTAEGARWLRTAGVNARHFAEAHFTWDAIVRRWLALVRHTSSEYLSHCQAGDCTVLHDKFATLPRMGIASVLSSPAADVVLSSTAIPRKAERILRLQTKRKADVQLRSRTEEAPIFPVFQGVEKVVLPLVLEGKTTEKVFISVASVSDPHAFLCCVFLVPQVLAEGSMAGFDMPANCRTQSCEAPGFEDVREQPSVQYDPRRHGPGVAVSVSLPRRMLKATQRQCSALPIETWLPEECGSGFLMVTAKGAFVTVPRSHGLLRDLEGPVYPLHLWRWGLAHWVRGIEFGAKFTSIRMSWTASHHSTVHVMRSEEQWANMADAFHQTGCIADGIWLALLQQQRSSGTADALMHPQLLRSILSSLFDVPPVIAPPVATCGSQTTLDSEASWRGLSKDLHKAAGCVASPGNKPNVIACIASVWRRRIERHAWGVTPLSLDGLPPLRNPPSGSELNGDVDPFAYSTFPNPLWAYRPRALKAVHSAAWSLNAFLVDLQFPGLRQTVFPETHGHQGTKAIGFLSPSLYQHSIGKALFSVIRCLVEDSRPVRVYLLSWQAKPSSTGLEAAAASSPGSSDPVLAAFYALRSQGLVIMDLPRNINAAATAVRRLQLDMVVFPDLGIHAAPQALAALRVAPVQCGFWGNPATSGSKEAVQCYLVGEDHLAAASKAVSLAELKEDFTETMYSVHGLGILPIRHSVALPFQSVSVNMLEANHYEQVFRESREYVNRALSLPSEGLLFVCSQALCKLDPEFDAELATVLCENPEARVVLLEGQGPAWKWQLISRFSMLHNPSLCKDWRERVHILPRLKSEEYTALVAAADVMIDSSHYSGFTTHVEALSLGKLVATCPRGSIRGSQTEALLHPHRSVTNCSLAEETRKLLHQRRVGVAPPADAVFQRHDKEAVCNSWVSIIHQILGS